MNESSANFVTVDVTVERMPGDVVPVGASARTPYLRGEDAVYLQGNRSSYELDDSDDLLAAYNDMSLIPFRAGGKRALTHDKDRITTGSTSFIGSYGQQIAVSTDGTQVGVHVGKDSVIRIDPARTRTVERDMEISYVNERQKSSSVETTVVCSVNHFGETRVVSHPSERVIPKRHRLAEYAERARRAQEGDAPVDRETVRRNGHDVLKTKNGTARIVSVPEFEAYVVERSFDGTNNGGEA